MSLILAIALASGCYGLSEPLPGPIDAAPPDAPVRDEPADRLDLLFVIDRSASMDRERASLAVDIPRMVRTLASGDLDADGTLELEPPRSIQVGVVTTDVIAGSAGLPGCNTAEGGGGVLATRGGEAAGCEASYPAVLRFELDADDPTAFASSAGCVAVVGLGGCAIEQPLEAALRALSPSSAQPWTAVDYVAPAFVDGASGHGDGANAGFAREGSMLVIVVVTDEDDASVADPELFDPASARYDGPLETRAARYPAALQPIERYVRGLTSLRRDPSDLALVVIGGVPADEGSMASCDRAVMLPAEEAIDPDLSDGTADGGVVCDTSSGRALWASRLRRASSIARAPRRRSSRSATRATRPRSTSS